MPEETEEVKTTQEEVKTDAKQGKSYDEDYVKDLRRESAGYRTQLRNVEQERDAALERIKELQGGTEEVSGRASELEKENARLKVALDKGLPKDLVPRLVGNTEEELAADADSLLALIGPDRRGNNDNGPRKNLEAPDIDTQIAEAERAQNWTLARTLKTQKVFQANNL